MTRVEELEKELSDVLERYKSRVQEIDGLREAMHCVGDHLRGALGKKAEGWHVLKIAEEICQELADCRRALVASAIKLGEKPKSGNKIIDALSLAGMPDRCVRALVDVGVADGARITWQCIADDGTIVSLMETIHEAKTGAAVAGNAQE